MKNDPCLDDLMHLWLEKKEQGKAPTPAELCWDCPELADELARRIVILQQFDGLVDTASYKLPLVQTLTKIGCEAAGKKDLQRSDDWPTVPGYEILEGLGEGGMGVVYKARQVGLKRIVALKVIRAGAQANGEAKARFRREAGAVAALGHSNIVQIFEIGEHAGSPFFSLEYIEGGSLDKQIAGLPQPQREAARIVEQLAQALQSAHERGIIHRDLKPANILISRDATSAAATHPLSGCVPKVTDFGLAKDLSDDAGLTQSGDIMGTPSYMAPEQTLGLATEMGHLVDVYALGAILFELLTGRPPFKGMTVQDTLNQVRRQEPIPPSRLQATVPRDLDVICLKCLEKDPQKRYPSATALAADLKRYLRGEPILARLPGITERAVQMLLRQQFGRNATAWGWALTLAGSINLVGYSAQAWCIESELSESILWGVFLTQQLSIAIALWLSLRGYRLSRGDRQGVHFMCAAIGTPVVAAFLVRFHEGMDPTAWLSLYPLFALLLGMIAFIEGPLYWGGNYLVAAGYVAIALVMKLYPSPWSPILFGLYLSLTLVPIGLCLLRLSKFPSLRK